MKTRVKTNTVTVIIGLLLVFALTVTVKAENTENVKVIMLSGKKVLLKVQNPARQNMQLEIKHNGSTLNLYSAKLPDEAVYAKVYDLSQLPEGKYKVALQLNNKVFEKEVSLSNEGSRLVSETTYYLPSFHQQDGNLLVSYPNPMKGSVSVTFYKENDGFFSDKPASPSVFQRNYILTNLEPGPYSVELSSDNETYSYYFDVK